MQFTATLSPSFTWSIHSLTSSNRSTTGWNSKGRLNASANPASLSPVSTKSCFDSPMPVILTWLGGFSLMAKLWKNPGHCKPCLMSKSMTCTLSFPSNALNNISLAVK
uniref:Uncharacterized protein n=1 Tax=Opuntia streptacantha TaxID=393608 RepID=A0A7C9A0J8_OPUST